MNQWKGASSIMLLPGRICTETPHQGRRTPWGGAPWAASCWWGPCRQGGRRTSEKGCSQITNVSLWKSQLFWFPKSQHLWNEDSWHCFYQLGQRFLICERFLRQFPADIVVAGADRVAGVRGGGAVGVARVTRVPPGVAVSPSSVRHAIRSEEIFQF